MQGSELRKWGRQSTHDWLETQGSKGGETTVLLLGCPALLTGLGKETKSLYGNVDRGFDWCVPWAESLRVLCCA